MNNIILVFFLVIRIISNPIANVFQKKLSAEIQSAIINFYTFLILSLFCIVFLNKYLIINTYNTNLLISVFAAGFLCAAGTFFLIKAINLGELSIIGPINSYKSITGLIIAFIFLREIPSFWGLIGMILIIAGSYFILDTLQEGFSFRILKRKDIQYRFLALFLTGIEAVILKHIIILTSEKECFIFWCLFGLFWSFIFVVLGNIKLRSASDFNSETSEHNLVSGAFFAASSPQKNWGSSYLKTLFESLKLCNLKQVLLLILISLFLGLMQYSTNYVFKQMNVGFALSLFQLSSILTVILGYRFFNEKSLLKKITGTLIMILGSCLIILNN